ncbi:MAG: SH3 domain-containing protein [Bacillota bacterium]|nr:SH3 domain-containing protein [Bacillota bacterium]
MDDIEKYREKFEEKVDNENLYQPRRLKKDELEVKGNKWIFPLVLAIILIVGAGAVGFLSSRNLIRLPGWLDGLFSSEVKTIQIILPEALFAGQDLEEVSARAVGEHGVIEVTPIEGDFLVFTMTTEVKNSLLVETENNLTDKIAAINDQGEHPEVVSISSDSAYKDFYLVVNPERSNKALVTASELFMLALYFQYLNAADLTPEVTVAVENRESGVLIEKLAYPENLNRAAAIIEDHAVMVDQPAVPKPGDKVVVSTGPDNLNLRRGPEITYLIVDVLRSGTVLEVTGSEGAWLEVVTPEGIEGWVHGSFVELQGHQD